MLRNSQSDWLYRHLLSIDRRRSRSCGFSCMYSIMGEQFQTKISYCISLIKCPGRLFQIPGFSLSISTIEPALFLYNFIFGKNPGVLLAYLTSYIHFDCFFNFQDSMGALIQREALNQGWVLNQGKMVKSVELTDQPLDYT